MRLQDYKEQYDKLSTKKNLSGSVALEAVKQNEYVLQYVNADLFRMTGKNNLCIGINAGLDITDQSCQVRIGDFGEDEVSLDTFKDCYIFFQNGRVVIKKNAINYDLTDLKNLWQ